MRAQSDEDLPVVFPERGARLAEGLEIERAGRDGDAFRFSVRNAGSAPADLRVVPRYFDGRGREVLYHSKALRLRAAPRETREVRFSIPLEIVKRVGVSIVTGKAEADYPPYSLPATTRLEVTRAEYERLRFLKYPDLLPVQFGNPSDDRPKMVGWYDRRTGMLVAAVELRIKAMARRPAAAANFLTNSAFHAGRLAYFRTEGEGDPSTGRRRCLAGQTRSGKEVLNPLRPLIRGLSEVALTLGPAGGPETTMAEWLEMESYQGDKQISKEPIGSVDDAFLSSPQVVVLPGIGKAGGVAPVKVMNVGATDAVVRLQVSDPASFVGTPNPKEETISLASGESMDYQVNTPTAGVVPLTYAVEAPDETGVLNQPVNGTLNGKGELVPDDAIRYLDTGGKVKTLNGNPVTSETVAPVSRGGSSRGDTLTKILKIVGMVAGGAGLLYAGYNVLIKDDGKGEEKSGDKEGVFSVAPRRVPAEVFNAYSKGGTKIEPEGVNGLEKDFNKEGTSHRPTVSKGVLTLSAPPTPAQVWETPITGITKDKMKPK